MSGKNSQTNELPTIWRVPDELWATIQPLLAELDPAKTTGRPRIDQRAALDALIFRLRSGCQGNQLPQEFPDDSSVHRTMQRWQQVGLFEQIWAGLLRECAELGGVDWEWQSADAWMSKARLGGDLIGRNPTDRGKKGVKKSLLVEASGGPLALALAGAHRHDSKLLAATLEAIVIERPQPSVEQPQHLCLDHQLQVKVFHRLSRWCFGGGSHLLARESLSGCGGFGASRHGATGRVGSNQLRSNVCEC